MDFDGDGQHRRDGAAHGGRGGAHPSRLPSRVATADSRMRSAECFSSPVCRRAAGWSQASGQAGGKSEDTVVSTLLGP